MIGRGARKVICWDLDETLGEFRDYGRLLRTAGIIPLLESYRRSGFVNVVTTAASKEHAEYVLSVAGMRHLFLSVFSRETICDEPGNDFNKRYMPVAGYFGLSADEAPHRILVVGNLERDAPYDSDLTFIHHPYGSTYHASVFGNVINRLMRTSDSWSYAHTMLLSANEGQLKMGYFWGGKLMIDGIMVGVGRSYWNPRPGKSSDRLIAVVSVPGVYSAEKEEIIRDPVTRTAHSL
ncbi:MAG: HAD family hydrolase [Candidatus Micrarchaeia archaeon]